MIKQYIVICLYLKVIAMLFYQIEIDKFAAHRKLLKSYHVFNIFYYTFTVLYVNNLRPSFKCFKHLFIMP